MTQSYLFSGIRICVIGIVEVYIIVIGEDERYTGVAEAEFQIQINHLIYIKTDFFFEEVVQGINR